MPRPRLFAIAAASALLSSCVFFPNIGKRIREAGEICTGVGMRPVDGKFYLTPRKRSSIPGLSYSGMYAHVPEVTFRRRSELFHVGALLDSARPPEAYDIRPTGRVRVAEFEHVDGKPLYPISVMDTIPAEASRVSKVENAEEIPAFVYSRRFPHSKASLGRELAAAPFDYAIDPALKIAFYTGEVVGQVATSPLLFLYSFACDQQQQKSPAQAEEGE